jgi:hypothetical protein
MAYTTIDNPELYFQVKTYTGDGGTTQALTLDGSENMQPDLVWVKMRSEGQSHILVDSVRGANKYLGSNHTGAEGTDINSVTAFGSDGFTVGNDNAVNKSSGTYVAWNWKETATAGFDIVSYTGNSSDGTTVQDISHSLSAVPHWIIVKNKADASNWAVYHKANTSAPQTEVIYLNLANATGDDSAFFGDTAPTSSQFRVGGDNGVNGNSDAMIAYLWSEKKGFSKFGSYIGNATGNGGGPFVYTGFKPAWVMIKNASAGSTDWLIFDNKRGGPVATYYGNNNKFFLEANENDAEANETFDMYSNGFKIKITNNFINGDGNTLIYMAFAEAPLVNSNGVPCNAR